MQWLTFSLGRFLPAYPEREEVVLSQVAASYLVVALIVVIGVSLAAPLAGAGRRRTEAVGARRHFFPGGELLGAHPCRLSNAATAAPLRRLRCAARGRRGRDRHRPRLPWLGQRRPAGRPRGREPLHQPAERAFGLAGRPDQAVGAATPCRAGRIRLAFRHDGCARRVHQPVGPLHHRGSDRDRGDRSVCRFLRSGHAHSARPHDGGRDGLQPDRPARVRGRGSRSGRALHPTSGRTAARARATHRHRLYHAGPGDHLRPAWQGIPAGRARADPMDCGRNRAERVSGVLSVPGVLLAQTAAEPNLRVISPARSSTSPSTSC